MRDRRVSAVVLGLSLAASVLVGVGGGLGTRLAAQVVLPESAALPNGSLARQVGGVPGAPAVTANPGGAPQTVVAVSDGSVPFVGAVRTGAAASVAVVAGGSSVGGELQW